MEKPQIITEYEYRIESLKERADQEGREFNFETEVKLLIEERILKIRSGNTPQSNSSKPLKIKSFYSPPVYDIPQLEYALQYLKFIQSNNGKKEEPSMPGTTRQSTLAIYYMQKAKAFPRTTGNKSEDAAFVRFLIGKDFDEIRKLLADPLKRPNEKTGKATENLIKDLIIVLNQFNKIQFFNGAKLVEKDIDTLKNDLKTFNPE